MSKSGLFNPRRWLTLALTCVSLLVLFAFQNCGKAGFDESSEDLNVSSLSTADPKLADAPFPFEANLNVISYMSCPMAGDKGNRRYPDDLANPFYTVRAGSYDNLSYAGIFGSSGLTDTEKVRRLQGGIGLSSSFVNYVSTKFGSADVNTLYRAVAGAPQSQDVQLTMALINEERSKEEGGFGFDKDMYYRFFNPLQSSAMASYLAQAPLNGSFGTQKKSFFSALDPAQRGLVGSISWGTSEQNRDQLNTELRSNLLLTMGYMSESSTDVGGLMSPGGDFYRSVYGTGYRLYFNQSMTGLTALKSQFLSDVHEVDMTAKPVTDISAAEAHKWDCFALRIVRHVDRLNPCTGQLQKVPANSTPIFSKYNCPNGNPSGTVVAGVGAACPVQFIDSDPNGHTTGTLNYVNGSGIALNSLRLQMARRVLPAELWEINTDPTYMCAVPTDLAMQRGACYVSGDQDTTKYIQYNLRGTIAGVSKDCGPGGNECPAYVSICYRTK